MASTTENNPDPARRDVSAVGDCAVPAQSQGAGEEKEGFIPRPIVHEGAYSGGAACEKSGREVFWPAAEQVSGARAWLVRVVARRAVEILKEQEKAP